MDELKKRYEENPRRFFAPLANEYRKAGDLDQAISLCQEHLDGQPGNMNGQVVYGQALFDDGRLDEAETTFGTALSLDPENLIALRHLGDIARSKNDAVKAVEWYRRVLDADPRNDEILGFIEELKAAPAPAAPTPLSTPLSTPAVPRAATPLATPAVPTPNEAKTVEISAEPRASIGTPTPIAAIESHAKPDEPKRPSIGLMDMSLDLGSEPSSAAPAAPAAPPPAAPPPAATTPAAPSAPVGDLDLSGMSFGEPEAAPVESSFDAPSSFDTPSHPAAPAGADLGVETGLGWDMGGNIDLDAQAAGTSPDEAAGTPETPQVFVTETMAELYLQQGFRDEALQVYRQLAELNPGDASLRDRIKHLESGDRSSMSLDAVVEVTPDFAPGTDSLIEMSAEKPAAPDAAPDAAPTAADLSAAMPSIEALSEAAMEPERAAAPPSVPTPASVTAVTARAYFASLAQRRAVRADGTTPAGVPVVAPPAALTPVLSAAGGSIDTLFDAPPADANDDAIGLALATAVGTVGTVDSGAPVRGRPTQAAASELTLDSVFRSESPLRTSGPVGRKSNVLKFDQFFESGDQAASATSDAGAMPPAAPPLAEHDAPAAPADDAQFNSWLQGLKGQ